MYVERERESDTDHVGEDSQTPHTIPTSSCGSRRGCRVRRIAPCFDSWSRGARTWGYVAYVST